MSAIIKSEIKNLGSLLGIIGVECSLLDIAIEHKESLESYVKSVINRKVAEIKSAAEEAELKFELLAPEEQAESVSEPEFALVDGEWVESNSAAGKEVFEKLDAELGETVAELEEKISGEPEWVTYHKSLGDSILPNDKSTVPPVKVGDIFYSSWGYDQTNIDFYEVVGITPSGKSVKIRPIASKTTPMNAYMSCREFPKKGEFIGSVMTKRLSKHSVGFKLSSYSSAWRWDGKERTSTHYA